MRTPIEPQLLFLGGLVVQATFTFTLSLLAWSDRRTRGMGWLAASSALTFVAMTYRMMRGLGENTPWDIPGLTVMISTLVCMYLGLRWFAVRRELSSYRWFYALGGAIVAALLTRHIVPAPATLLLRACALSMVFVTAVMLWQTKFPGLRVVTRAIAVMFGLFTAILLARLVMVGLVGNSGGGPIPLILYGRAAVLVATTIMQFFFVALFVAESKRRLHEETRQDALTGLQNRRSIEECAMVAVKVAREHHQPLSLVMLDLDHFKVLNDTWGHGLGDRALRAVGGALLAELGDGYCVARLGGEEFAVLLTEMDMQAAAVVAEQLRAAVEKLRLAQQGDVATVTTSVGVSSLRDEDSDWSGLLHRADVALYEAKRNGRNRVVLCTAELEQTPEVISAVPRMQRRDWRKALLGRGPLL